MNTFETQFNLLSPGAQARFEHIWGREPWKNPIYKQLHMRRQWKANLFARPISPRWQQYNIHPESPLWMALRAKNRRAAHRILDKVDALSRKEAADCALLTLQWAPDLLARILNKTTGRPFVWLRHQITLDHENQLGLSLCGSLVMIAAALNDLPCLNVLLEHGGQPDYNFLRDRWDIVGDLLMGGVTMGALNSPEYSLHQVKMSRFFLDESISALPGADPLAAAIFCNAGRCAARLLEEPSVTVTPAVRRALALMPLNETQAFVAAQLNTPLEQLLLPEDFGPGMDHPLLYAVLERHNGILPRQNAERFVANYASTDDEAQRRRQIEIFALMDADLLGDVVWETWQRDARRTHLLELADTFALPVNRCRVSEQLYKDKLLPLMEHFLITGDAPENGLSGLACSLLHLLEDGFRTQPMSVEQLLHIPGAARVLETEQPDVLAAWLDAHPEIPINQTLPLKALLDIQKEVAYEL